MELSDDLSMGERIRVLREQRGMSRPVLAGLCGRGPDWLKKIETGDRELRSHTLLLRLATALRVDDVAVITGPQAAASTVNTGRLYHPAVPAIWAAVMARTRATAADAPNVTVLQRRADDAWHLWHLSGHNRTEVGGLLPRLITDAEAAVRASEAPGRRRALVALSDVYRLAGQATAYVAPAELAWVLADRAMTAAQDADDPTAIGAAAWNLANILRETAYPDEALQTVTDAAALLRPHLDDGSDDLRGVYGALQLHAAVTAAREGRDGDAWRFWGAGHDVARRLPNGYVHASTVFGQPNVAFHEVSVAMDLRASGRALALAGAIDPDTMPSVERRSRLWVEVARGYMQQHDHAAALGVMDKAYGISPETVSFTPSARIIAADLWRTAGRGQRQQAARLAKRIGVAVAQ